MFNKSNNEKKENQSFNKNDKAPVGKEDKTYSFERSSETEGPKINNVPQPKNVSSPKDTKTSLETNREKEASTKGKKDNEDISEVEENLDEHDQLANQGKR